MPFRHYDTIGEDMGNQQSLVNFKFVLSILGIMLSLAGIAALVRGILDGVPVAYMVMGAIVFLVVTGMGGVSVLAVEWIGEAREARREAREQARFRDNAKENMAIMALTARAQSAQNAMLMRQVGHPALPGGEPVEMIEYDPTIFDEMAGE
jgi:Na+/melibiose symporter-like transporter